MEHLNQTFFLWLNAPEHPNALVVTLATFFAEWLIWAVPILIGIGWLRGNENTRKALLVATTSGLLGLLINQIIGLAWSHPRPFMIGLGHTLIPQRSPDAVVVGCLQLSATAKTTKGWHGLGTVWHTNRLVTHLPRR